MAGDSHWGLVKQGAEAKLYTGAYLGQPAIMKVCLAAIIGYIYMSHFAYACKMEFPA